MTAAVGVLAKLLLSAVLLLGALKLVFVPRSLEPSEARLLYRLRCGGGAGVPFEFDLMTLIGKPTVKGVGEFVSCRSSTDTHGALRDNDE